MGKPRNALKATVRSYLPISDAVRPDNIRNSIRDFKNIAKSVYTKPAEEHHESYDEALARMNITAADLEERVKGLKIQFIFFLVASLGCLFYGFYLFVSGMINSGLLGFAVSTLAGVFAFKRHFWLFQIRTKHLGSTFQDWWADFKGSN